VYVHGIELRQRYVQALHAWASDANTPLELVGWLQTIEQTTPSVLWRVGIVNGPTLQSAFLVPETGMKVDESQGSAVPRAWLEIIARHEGADMYRAERVKVLAQAPKRVFQGVVTAAPADGRIGEWKVDQYRVISTAATAVTGNPRKGSSVQVSGRLNYDASISAEMIKVLTSP
jgi:hypothetical protein